jgi:hypothetical protein
MAYGSPQFKDPRVLSAGQFNDVTQIDRVSPNTFENPGVPVGDVSTMKPASNPVTVQHRNGAGRSRAEAVRATTGT